MASAYLQWKYRDVKPDEPIPLTPKERRRNWWHYHKWHVCAAAVLLLISADIGLHALGQRKPDYQVAYLGTAALPEDTAAALERSLAELGEDCNGDGIVTVQLNQYLTPTPEDRSETALYASASGLTLMADLESCDSYLFLLEDPETFQTDYQILRNLDGSLPENGDKRAYCLPWSDCPVLETLPLGEYTETVLGYEFSGGSQELLSRLYLARRGFWTEKTVQNLEACDLLWDRLTEGAIG